MIRTRDNNIRWRVVDCDLLGGLQEPSLVTSKTGGKESLVVRGHHHGDGVVACRDHGDRVMVLVRDDQYGGDGGDTSLHETGVLSLITNCYIVRSTDKYLLRRICYQDIKNFRTLLKLQLLDLNYTEEEEAIILCFGWVKCIFGTFNNPCLGIHSLNLGILLVYLLQVPPHQLVPHDGGLRVAGGAGAGVDNTLLIMFYRSNSGYVNIARSILYSSSQLARGLTDPIHSFALYVGNLDVVLKIDPKYDSRCKPLPSLHYRHFLHININDLPILISCNDLHGRCRMGRSLILMWSILYSSSQYARGLTDLIH